MELRQYLAVLWRRWPVIAVIVGIAALASAINFINTAPAYSASVRLLVRQEAIPESPAYFTYDRYYSWLANEFLSDDYSLIVPSRAFAERVAALLRENPQVPGPDGTTVPKYGEVDLSAITPDDVYTTLSAERKHRILTITAQTGVYGYAPAFANAAGDVLTAMSLQHAPAPALSAVQIQDKVQFGLLDSTNANGIRSSRTRGLINAGVGLALGLVAALALAFLIDYLDTRLRDESEAERLLGVPVLGAIPRK